MTELKECSVCYTDFNSFSFQLKCRHDLCHPCYLKLALKVCPICREKIKFTKNGKIKLSLFSKIKRHLQFKYNLPVKRNNRNLRIKHKLLRIALGGV